MRKLVVVLLASIALSISWPQTPLVSAAPSTVATTVSSVAAAKGGRAPILFNMLAASWADKRVHHVEYRTSADGSTWTAWAELEVEEAEAPDGDQPEAKKYTPGRFTALAWVGEARFVQTRGLPPGKVHLLNVNGNADDPGFATRTLRSMSRWARGSAQAYAAGRGPIGIYTRSEWGADETIREQTLPSYAPTAKMALIHHTDNSNSYSASQVPAILRGIYSYHVRSRGYRDIAYNFLVDKWGRLWEGRWGGMAKPVVGGHTAGFNYETIGVAMIGNFTSTTPTTYMQSAIARLLSWKFTIHKIRPRASTKMIARSSPAGGVRWKPGTEVTLNTISAHRDVNTTACNGTYGYRVLNNIRNKVWVKQPPAGAWVSDLERVWFLTPYGKYGAPHWMVWRSNVPDAEVLRLTKDELSEYPILGNMTFRNGLLVRGIRPPDPLPEPDPTASPTATPSATPPGTSTTYVASNGWLRPFQSDADIVAMGYDTSTIVDVAGSVLAEYPVGSPVTPGDYPDGTLLRSPAASVPYVIQGGKRLAVVSQVFPSWKFSTSEIVDVPANVMSAIPFGGHLLFREGSLVRSTSGRDQTVYVISRGLRRPIANSFVFGLLGYKASNIRPASDTVLNLHPLGRVVDGRGP